MGVYELSGAGSVKTGRTLYTSMNANNQYGAMVPIGSFVSTGSSLFPNFVSIPSVYQDLRFVIFGRTTNAVTTDFLSLNLNSDYGSNYSETFLRGNGSTATSARFTNQTRINQALIPGSSATGGVFSAITIDILNYANTTTFKTLLFRNAFDLNGSGSTSLQVGLWRSQQAINQVDCNLGEGNGNWASGSTITLYGIRAVSS